MYIWGVPSKPIYVTAWLNLPQRQIDPCQWFKETQYCGIWDWTRNTTKRRERTLGNHLEHTALKATGNNLIFSMRTSWVTILKRETKEIQYPENIEWWKVICLITECNRTRRNPKVNQNTPRADDETEKFTQEHYSRFSMEHFGREKGTRTTNQDIEHIARNSFDSLRP